MLLLKSSFIFPWVRSFLVFRFNLTERNVCSLCRDEFRSWQSDYYRQKFWWCRIFNYLCKKRMKSLSPDPKTQTCIFYNPAFFQMASCFKETTFSWLVFFSLFRYEYSSRIFHNEPSIFQRSCRRYQFLIDWETLTYFLLPNTPRL